MTIENASDNELVFQSKEILLNFTHIFAKLAQEFGRTKEESIQIAEISISLLQGGLIQTRILKDNRIFKSQVEFIKQLLKNGIHQKV